MKYFVFLFIVFALASCKNYTKENQELRNELRSLEYEFSSLQGSPGCMLGEAFESLELKKYDEAITKINEVKESFPEWNEGIMDELIKIIVREEKTVTQTED